MSVIFLLLIAYIKCLKIFHEQFPRVGNTGCVLFFFREYYRTMRSSRVQRLLWLSESHVPGLGGFLTHFPQLSPTYTLASHVPDAKLFISFREVGGSSHRVFNITNHLLQRCARHPVMASRIWRSSRKTYDHVADRVTWLVSGPRSLAGASAGSCACVKWCV